MADLQTCGKPKDHAVSQSALVSQSESAEGLEPQGFRWS